MKYLKLYFWAIKNSYSYMEGLRTPMFWLKLPLKAHFIAYYTLRDECGPDCKSKKHNEELKKTI